MKIGAQLYTVRDFCKNLNDFSETLKKIADIGYTTVQVSGTCGYEADWLAEELRKNALTCALTHYSYDKIINETEKTVEDHKKFGCSIIGVGALPGLSADPAVLRQSYDKFVENAKGPARKIHELGATFSYHNHNFEFLNKFEDGRPLFWHMAEDFAPEELSFTLDTYWVKAGGYDVLEEIKRLRGRLPAVHYKDMLIDSENHQLMYYIGGGNTFDFEKITEAFIDAGTKFALVEQDNCNGEDPFVCLKKSYDYLRSIGLD